MRSVISPITGKPWRINAGAKTCDRCLMPDANGYCSLWCVKLIKYREDVTWSTQRCPQCVAAEIPDPAATAARADKPPIARRSVKFVVNVDLYQNTVFADTMPMVIQKLTDHTAHLLLWLTRGSFAPAVTIVQDEAISQTSK